MPSPRGPFPEQQFNSGEPSRAWNTISCADALRTPSIGVLYVHHRPEGCCAPRMPVKGDSSISSATSELPVIRNMSIESAVHAMVQQVSMARGSYGLPTAASPDENPPVLWRSPLTMLHQMCSKARRYRSSPLMKYNSAMA